MEISKSLMNWPVLSMLEPEFTSTIDMVLVHGCAGGEALIVTHDRTVYAMEGKKDDYFGLGGVLRPTKLDIFCEKNIKTFAHGSSFHVLALTVDGQVYSWGNNAYFQLGNESDNTKSSATPTLVAGDLSDTFVVDIACGKFHSLALTRDSEVYEWGIRKHEWYPHTDCPFIMTPTRVRSKFDGKRIVCVSCGELYSMAVNVDGEVYGWGKNDYGQLGIGNYDDQAEPCKLKELTGIVIEKIVCGNRHTLALSDKGILYTWGANTYGQLGRSTDTKVCNPMQVEMLLTGRVLDIAASSDNHISVAIGEGNRVYIWGECLQQSIRIPTRTSHRCLYDALACYATHNVMHQPLLLRGKGTTNLTDCLKGAFNDETTSDLAIRVEGSLIHVHKAILMIRCRHFRTMFQEHCAGNNQRVIEHEQFSFKVYRAFLEYLYTDEIDVPIEDALEFLDLTTAYSERQLQSRWIRSIKNDITVRNAISLYKAAVHYSAKELEEYCFPFAENHTAAVAWTPSFGKLDPLTTQPFETKAANACTSKTLFVESCRNVKMTARHLMKWKIIRSLEPKFISKIRMVIVFGNFGCSALIVTKDGLVYGLGCNIFGCLGTGDTCSSLCPTKVKALSGKGMKTFARTVDETLALTEKGEVYSWGRGYGNIHGYEPTSLDLTPTLMEGYPSETFVVDLACGQYHSLALTKDGKVYAWGNNEYGQVDGSKSSNENVCKKVGVILLGKKIVYIRCCSASSMAITSEGEVYSWGCNTTGELGQGDCNEADGVRKVLIPTDVVIEKIACGESHTLALSNEGVLYVWGDNSCGQLGLGHTINCCTPVKLNVKEMGRILDVAASPFDNISVAMCEHNRVFVWGQCIGQWLGEPTRTPFECLHDAFAHLASYSNMHQPLIVSSEEEMSITDNLGHAFDDVATSDLTIHVGAKPIYVHKAILKIRSQYFRNTFEVHCEENNQSVIEHGQFSYHVYRAFLEYLYTDQIYLPAENVRELIDLAVTYSDSVLTDRCISLAKSGIKVGNVVSMYSIGTKHDLKELQQCCLNFIMNNVSTVVETRDFSKLDQFAIKSLIIKAVKPVNNWSRMVETLDFSKLNELTIKSLIIGIVKRACF